MAPFYLTELLIDGGRRMRADLKERLVQRPGELGRGSKRPRPRHLTVSREVTSEAVPIGPSRLLGIEQDGDTHTRSGFKSESLQPLRSG